MPPKYTPSFSIYLSNGMTLIPVYYVPDLTDGDLEDGPDKFHDVMDVTITLDIAHIDKLLFRTLMGLPVTNNWRRMHGYPMRRRKAK